MRTVSCLQNDRGAIAWGWLLVLLVVAVAAAAAVYLYRPPMVSDAPPAVVRGRIPPMTASALPPPESEAKAAPETGGGGLTADNQGQDELPPAAKHTAAGTVGPVTASEPASSAAAGESDATGPSSAPDAVPAATPDTDTPAAVSAGSVRPDADVAAAPSSQTIDGAGASSRESEPPYRVQTGAFRNRKHADTQAAELAWRGYPPHIVSLTTTDGILYLVCFGRFQTRSDAARAAAAFTDKESLPAVVVRTARP